MSLYSRSRRDENGGGDNERFDEFTAREPDNYAEAYRQKEILSTSSDVGSVFFETKQAMEHGEINEMARQSIVKSAVDRLIIDVENIMQSTGAISLLDDKEGEIIHKVQLNPPDELYALVRDDDVNIIGEVDLSPKEALTIRGLWGYLNAPEIIAAEWTIQADVRNHKPQPVSRQSATRMPVEASKAAYREVRKFLADVDLDLGPKLPDYKGGEEPGI